MIEKRIKEFFVQKRKADNLEFDTDLFKNKVVDSLFAFEMVVFLEDTFKVRIKDSEITEDNFRSINSIADMIRRSGGK